MISVEKDLSDGSKSKNNSVKTCHKSSDVQESKSNTQENNENSVLSLDNHIFICLICQKQLNSSQDSWSNIFQQSSSSKGTKMSKLICNLMGDRKITFTSELVINYSFFY